VRLIVISDSRYFAGEEDLVHAMFEAGLETFHIRKPKMSTEAMRTFLDKIHSKYYSRIVIHSHHELAYKLNLKGIHLSDKHLKDHFLEAWLRMKYLKFKRPDLQISTSFHDLGTLLKSSTNYSYVFLSPIFDSISKLGYKNRFNMETLLTAIKKSQYELVALGGVDEQYIQQIKDMGFKGCAVLGSIWMSDSPVDKFKTIQKLCREVSHES
jgi:thiamine-phosphate pyrophosphorylase